MDNYRQHIKQFILSTALETRKDGKMQKMGTQELKTSHLMTISTTLSSLSHVLDTGQKSKGNTTLYYFILDVKESECWVLSTKSQNDCLEASRPIEIVIGQCKVIATRYSNESQDFRVSNYNCTTSSVSSALSNTKDSPVLLEYLEESEVHRQQAQNALDKYKGENEGFASFRVDRVERVIKARGGERTNYYVDFSMQNCSTQHFHRRPPVFGFCRAVLSYNVDATDLETPENIDINCEVFDFEARNASDIKPHWGHEHSPFGKHPHGPHGREHHGPPPHGPPPHGYPPHGPPPHGPPPHGYPPHGHPPHGHPPHGHDFHDYGPCDPPSNDQEHKGLPHHRGHGPPHHRGHGPPHHRGHGPPHHRGHGPPHHRGHGPPHHRGHGPPHHWGYGPPHGHSGERGKGFSLFHHQQVRSIYRLPPLNAGEVLAMPEANFPSNSMSNCKNPLQPEIQPFPEVASESCPGKFKSEFPQISKFFANMPPK